MMHQSQWATVSVGDFFQGYNWRGTAPVLDSSVTEKSLKDLPSLLCLSVADFLGQANWSGHRSTPDTAVADSQRAIAAVRTLSITASVGEFCQGINWRGTGVATAPKKVPAPAAPAPQPLMAKPDPSIGLSDLSDLF